MNSIYSIEREKGSVLSCCSWIPDEYRNIVLIVHGLGEHSGRYAKVAKALNDKGSAVFSFDLRGHGKSSGNRGHIGSYRTAFADIEVVACRAREIAGQLPLFIYGHSLGGGIVLGKRLTGDTGCSGYIATSPWLELVKPPSPIVSAIVRALKPIAPSLTVDSKLDADLLTSDKSVVDEYRNDPMVHGKISIGTAVDAMAYSELVLKSASVTRSRLLLAHGSNDGIVRIKGSRKLAESSSSAVSFVEMPGMHELHNEPDCFQGLIDCMVAFMASES